MPNFGGEQYTKIIHEDFNYENLVFWHLVSDTYI